MNISISNNKILLLPIFICFVITACEKTTEYNALTGELIGFVSLYNSDGQAMTDYSGVEIVLEGSNPQVSTITDNKGQYIFENLKSGTYNILLNKGGYCQHKIAGFQFVGGSQPATAGQTDLYKLSNIQLDILEIITYGGTNSTRFVVNIKFSEQIENKPRFLRYYIGDNHDVSYKDYTLTDFSSYPDKETINIYIQCDKQEYPAGSELYLIVYPAPEPEQYYTDINTGMKIYTGININKPTGVANITIPWE